jgi:methionine-rich copper-binding protein CopC
MLSTYDTENKLEEPMIHPNITKIKRSLRWSVGVIAFAVTVSSLSLAHSAVAHAAQPNSASIKNLLFNAVPATSGLSGGSGLPHISTSQKALAAYKSEQAYNKVGLRQDMANQVSNRLQSQIPAGDFITAELQADGLHIQLRYSPSLQTNRQLRR